MLPLYHKKCKIMYTDTDSLIYHIECDDVYDIIKREITKFNTSDYPTTHMVLINKKVPA